MLDQAGNEMTYWGGRVDDDRWVVVFETDSGYFTATGIGLGSVHLLQGYTPRNAWVSPNAPEEVMHEVRMRLVFHDGNLNVLENNGRSDSNEGGHG